MSDKKADFEAVRQIYTVLVLHFMDGMTQQAILPGDLHWIVRVMHLVIGLAAMPIAERLAGSPARASLQPA